MTVVLKEDYVAKLEEYHKFLTAIIEKHYNLGVKYLESYAWGLSSATFYVKTAKGDFTAKVSQHSPELVKQIEVDAALSAFLHPEIPTSEYVLSSDNKIQIQFKDPNNQEKILRITKHLVGISPFEMKYQYLESGISWLKKLHMHKLPTQNLVQLPSLTLDNSPKYFLHGDITPNNFLIFFEKVDALLDFGLASMGPVEYDLSRLVLFTWFRMPHNEFKDILLSAITFYNRARPEFNIPTNLNPNLEPISLNENLIMHYTKEHCSSYLRDVLKHKSSYMDEKKWQSDYDFVRDKLEFLARIH